MALNYKKDGDGTCGMEIKPGALEGCVVLSATEPARLHAASGLNNNGMGPDRRVTVIEH